MLNMERLTFDWVVIMLMWVFYFIAFLFGNMWFLVPMVICALYMIYEILRIRKMVK